MLLGCYNPIEYEPTNIGNKIRDYDKCLHCMFLENKDGCLEYREKKGNVQFFV